jgi:hypothetical protein
LSDRQELLPPGLSVIVPVLNEQETLPKLLQNLAAQAGVNFETILCDGGSHDDTQQVADGLAKVLPLRISVVAAPAGRARQLNAGVVASRAPLLLFLHADSHFPDRHALERAVRLLETGCRQAGTDRLAGRFRLVFRQSGNQAARAFAFHEAKARQNRPGCIHGDQGFMLFRTFFDTIGPFPAGPPMLAETRLADRILDEGEWLLFPDEIQTSVRRFETEGLRERQTLNALIMGAAAARWDRFFAELPQLYRQQARSGRLQLGPILASIDGLLAELPPTERRLLWRSIGGYVRDNAWQIPFFLDMRRCFHLDPAARQPLTPLTTGFERWLAPLLSGSAGAELAALLTRFWFRWLLWRETTVQVGNR